MFIGKTVSFQRGKTVINADVIAETKSSFKVRVSGAAKTLLKSAYDIHFDGIRVSGSLLGKKPEDRIKGV